MKYLSYSIDTLGQADLSIVDNQINADGNRIKATIKDSRGNLLTAFLKGNSSDKVTVPSSPKPFPKNWFIVHAIPNGKPGDKEEHFFLTIRNEERLSDLRATLPVNIGDSIHVKSRDGVYKIVYLNRDILIITCKPWAKDYLGDKRESPNETILWDNYKCKHRIGESNTQ